MRAAAVKPPDSLVPIPSDFQLTVDGSAPGIIWGPRAHVGHPAWVMNLWEGYPTWVTIPGPPHANQRPRRSRAAGGRMWKPDSAQERSISWQMRSQWRGAPLEGRLALYARFYVAKDIKDASNMLKAVEDAGNGILWRDDKQIKALVVLVDIDRGNPRTVLAFGPRREL
jgi:Holliday junction resolvase RusA-like endonuclease